MVSWPAGKGVSRGELRGRPLPLGKFDAPQGYQNNDFHLKIRAVYSLMSSEKCHITIFARPPATAMKFDYRRATADLFPSSHKIQLTNHLSEISAAGSSVAVCIKIPTQLTAFNMSTVQAG